jgi:MoaA/NifB/PqqE/SkfB family radical SAM enzyme
VSSRAGGSRIRNLLGRTRAPDGEPDASAVTRPLEAACYAAHSALYLRPDGIVHACCATAYELGSVTGPDRRSLREIWEGAELAALRERLEEGRFDYGCQECAQAIDAGGRGASLAANFDRWAPGSPHPGPRLLDLALSNRCNLECVMCNGELSSTIRSKREGRPPLPSAYDDAFFEELFALLPDVERLQFKGGEPFLAPENRRIWDELIDRGLRPEVVVTTNGTIWNERVERYVRELRMELNISIDAITPGVLEAIRVGTDATQLWANVDRLQALSEEVGQRLTLSFCLMPDNWRELPAFLAEVERRGVNGNVIFVNQPHRHDLLRRPTAELQEVASALRASLGQLSTPGARAELEHVVARIDAQVEHPVFLRVRVEKDLRPTVNPPLTDSDRIDLEVVRSEALAWVDLEPAVATVVNGVVTDCSVPEWAGWLGSDRWIGIHEREMPRLLGELWGIEPEVDVAVSQLAGVDDVRITCPLPSGTRTLRVLAYTDPDDAADVVRWFISERVEEPAV